MVRTPWHLKEEVEVSCRRVLVWHSNGSEEIFEIDEDLGLSPSEQAIKHFLIKRKGVQDIASLKMI